MGILQSREVYNRYYGDFRGVDFSSDHTQVDSQRLAYAVNMYKDYQSGQGQALETVPGFRKRLILPEDAEVYGIHYFKHGGTTHVLVHAGDKLYRWYNYPKTTGVTQTVTVALPEPVVLDSGARCFTVSMPDNVREIKAVYTQGGESVYLGDGALEIPPPTLLLTSFTLAAGDLISVHYREAVTSGYDWLDPLVYDGMNTRRSTSFVFNNRLYIIDGKNYLVYDGDTVRSVTECAYVPTTYINIIPAGENADIGTEYEQRNILQPKFKHTFIADGETTEFYMNENLLDAITEVKVYDFVLSEGTDYTVDLSSGKVSFAVAPPKPETAPLFEEIGKEDPICYPEFYAGVEITASKVMKTVSGVTDETDVVSSLVTDCTVVALFDNRVFLSGNPAYPNHLFYCGRNLTGYVDPTYFSITSYQQDGVGLTPITGMIPVADTLMVLKGDTRQDGSIYFHSAVETGEDLVPKIYPSVQGLGGIGCLGACVNFLDDPVFISRLGVEAVGQLSVRYERAVEHRSALIDAKLVNLDLTRAALAEWNGYLAVLIDGKMFLADSRQRYTHDTGVMQYEWYYLEDIGVWDGQYPEYRYAPEMYRYLVDADVKVKYCKRCHRSEKHCICETEGLVADLVELPLQLADRVYDPELDAYEDLMGQVANPPDESGNETRSVMDEWIEVELDGVEYGTGVYFTVHETKDPADGETVTGYAAYICEAKGNCTGGVFRPATVLCSLDDNLFFGTESGVVCSFNFDKRDEDGTIAPQYYDFDGRTILCGCATRMDSCDVPHMTKNTVKKSTVVKTKSFRSSAAKIKVRTNRKPYEQIARINSGLFSFDNVDFADFTFNTSEQSLFAVKEKERRWVEKQYYVYSDEYRKPFALYYISYRYSVAGRYKE